MLEIEWILSFLLLGAVVGFMAGLLGVGGGGLMVPVLTAMFMYHGVGVDKVVHLALGTSMASIIFTSISSMRAHNSKGCVIWKVVKGMSVGIVIGSFLATYIVALVKSMYLAIFFSLFMAYVSIQMFVNKKPKAKNKVGGSKDLFFAGNIIGGISALVSIGGGSLTVPYLVWRNIDVKTAIGTSAAVGLPISIAGTLGYLINGWSNTSTDNYVYGFIYLPAVILISITSFISAPYGAKMAHYLPVAVLKKVFAVLLITLSLKMLFSIA